MYIKDLLDLFLASSVAATRRITLELQHLHLQTSKIYVRKGKPMSEFGGAAKGDLTL